MVGGPLPERTGKDEPEDKDPAHRDDSVGDEGREAIGQVLVDSGNSSIGIDSDRS